MIRPADKSDHSAILEVLKEADLLYPYNVLEGFTVVEENHQIVGVVRLQEINGIIFLTSLGVRTAWRGQGIASSLMKAVLSSNKKPIYLYTVIPDFFKRFGFAEMPAPATLPPKQIFGCEDCYPGRCICMGKFSNDT